MATVTITRTTTLPDSCGKSDFHDLLDQASGSVSNIANADVSASAAIADTKLAQITTSNKVAVSALTVPVHQSTLEIVIGNGSDVISTGVALDVQFPFACTITGVRLFAKQTGSIVVDIWKDTYANFPPTAADTITSATHPTLASAAKSEDLALTGWTTGISSGDILRINVDSASTVTQVTLALSFTRV